VSGVSVIIPTLKSAYLRDALVSVFSQTFLPTEVVVVDGSPDVTLPVIAEYGDRIRYYYQTPNGVSAARNFGMQMSKGEYIALLDADDLWLPNKLENQVKAFSLCPGAGFCFAGIWNLCDFDAPMIPQELFVPTALTKWMQEHSLSEDISYGFAYSLLLQVNCIGTSSLVIKRNALKNDLFDEDLKNAEDYDFELRIAKRLPGIYLHNPVSRYRIHNQGLSGSWESRPQVFYDSNIRVLKKHLRLDFSAEILRSLATTYREYASWCLNSSRASKASLLALTSFCLRPSAEALKVAAESLTPSFYRFLSKTIARPRANT
jgi:glycosyltransferase involved in cell wall biosynthesis